MECVLCSLCAAAAGAAMKVAFSQSIGVEAKDLAWRGGALVVGLLLNSLMLKFFVDSLKIRSAFATTVSTFALNFIASATFGILLFNEPIRGIQWWVGVFLMMIGVFVTSFKKEEKDKEKKK